MRDSIKIRWTGDARSKLGTRYIESRLTSREDETAEVAQRAWDTLTRQKTNVVVETEAEAEALERYLQRAVRDGDDGRTWTTPAHLSAFERVYNTLIDEMKERSWGDHTPETDELQPGSTLQLDCEECDRTLAGTVQEMMVVPCLCGNEIPVEQ